MLVYPHGARRVGRYLLCDQVGSGGMATIHLARLLGAQGFSRTVAVKQLHPQFAQNPQFVSMLLDEARMAVRVRHGNVISPLDIVATGSELFIVMDYVNGETFANLLVAARGPLRPSVAAAILVQVLLGLHAAHEATREQGEALGLVHRDVSPQNILVGQDGVSRVLDFGIAKAATRKNATQGGMVKGKPGYLAPEQVRLEAVDRRTDLFSAGIVLWEALTGNGLFTADTLGASIDRLLHGKIVPPSQLNPAVTPELDAVVLRALERDRDARYPDAMSMAAALERAVPLASAFEIIEWVEKLAGPSLAHKANLVKRAEALNWEPVHTIGPTLAATSTPPVSTSSMSPGWSEPVSPGAQPDFIKSTLKGIAKPPPAPDAGSVPMATGESTGVAVGGDRDVSGVTGARGGRGWKSMGVTLGIVATASTLALGGFMALSGRELASSSAADRQPLGVASRLAIESAPPAPPRFETPDPPRPAPSPISLALTPAPGILITANTSDSSGSRDSAPAKAPLSHPGSRVDNQRARNATGTRKALTPRSARDDCQPPWFINEHQIKVFKEECLR